MAALAPSGPLPGRLVADATALIDALGLGLQPRGARTSSVMRGPRGSSTVTRSPDRTVSAGRVNAIERAAGDRDCPCRCRRRRVGLGQLEPPAELDRPTVELVSRIHTGQGRDAFIRDGSVLIRGYGRLMPAGNCRCLGIGLASAGWLTGLVCRMVRQLN